MKQKFILLALMAFSIQAYSQTKNTLAVMGGFGQNEGNLPRFLDFSFAPEPAYTLGVEYIRAINSHFSVETGLVYSSNNTIDQRFDDNDKGYEYKSTIDMITIPLLARFTFAKYMFATVGVNVDLHTNYDSTIRIPANQTGLGFETGVGGKFEIEKQYVIFIYPYLRSSGLVKFAKDSDFQLAGWGIKIGAGYSF